MATTSVARFLATSVTSGSVRQQMSQYFRVNPGLVPVQVLIDRPENDGGGQSYGISVVCVSGGQRTFVAEYIGNRNQSADVQASAFLSSNPNASVVAVVDVTSPDPGAFRMTRLLVLYTFGDPRCLTSSGTVFSQGTLTADAIGTGERIGSGGATSEVLSVRNVGDAPWPTGARGVLLRVRGSGVWGGIGKRTYAGAIPPFSSATTYAPFTPGVACCDGGGGAGGSSSTTPPPTTSNTSSTTNTSTGTTSTTTPPPAFSTTTSSTTTPPQYPIPTNGNCYSQYSSNWQCESRSWTAPALISTVCQATAPGAIGTWALTGSCEAKAWFQGAACQVGGP
jgi:hypothetical protein